MATLRLIESMDFESNTKNWKYPFKDMTKRCGGEFIDFLRAMWEANVDVQTEDEFCEMNDLSLAFFNKVIKEVVISNPKTARVFLFNGETFDEIYENL